MFRSRIILGAFISCFAGSALAQLAADTPVEVDPDGKAQVIDKVYVTGSNIRRTDTETASPVQVITHADIERQGVTNVSDLIANLSASSTSGTLTDINGSNSFAPGGTAIGLRNLGEQATLVLVNGRRLASYALADFSNVFTNVDVIPIDSIERVEVLKSGASAIYGSDAVAGVINIITYQNYQGLRASADRTQSISTGTFGTSKASITGGYGDFNSDGYNVLVNADFFKRDNVMFTNLLGYTNPQLTKTSPSFGSFSSYSYPGNIIDGGNTQPVAGCAADLIIDGLCKYNRYERFQAVPSSQRENFFGSASYNLGEGRTAFVEGMYSKIETDYLSTYPIYGDSLGPVQWGNPSTGQPLVFNYLGLAANSPLNPTGDDGIGYRYRFVDAPSYQTVDSSQYRFLGGLRGSFHNFDYELAAGLMGSETDDAQRGSFSSSGFISTIGNYNNFRLNTNPNVNLAYTADDPNFFAQPNGYHPGQHNSSAVLNALFPEYGYSGKNDQSFADAKANGPIYTLPAGDMQLAVGAELHHESYSIDPTGNLSDGDIVGNGISSANSSRNWEAAYAELDVPVLKNLEMTVAGRVDKFPNFEAHFSPKLGLKFTPTDGVVLRGTYETGFRAPNLIESANSLKFAFDSGTTDPLRCAQATALANALNTQAQSLNPNDPNVALLEARAESVQNNECNFGLADEVKNNPNLKPETSKSFSFGVVLEPVKAFSVSLDYWNIIRQNQIGLLSTQQLLNGTVEPGTVVNRAPLNPNADPSFSAAEIAEYGVTVGPLLNVIRQFENIAEQKTSGIDIDLRSSIDTAYAGKFSADMDATYTLTYKDSSISSISENLVGEYSYPHFVANLTLSNQYGPFTNALRTNFFGGYQLQLGQADTTYSLDGCAAAGYTTYQCRVASQTTFDYYLAYTGVKNATVSVNLLNIFARHQAADLRAFGFGGIIPSNYFDAEGRMLRVAFSYKFL